MTGVERMQSLFNHKKPDRIGLYEHFWGDTHQSWTANGDIPPDTDVADLFPFDMTSSWPLNTIVDLDFAEETVAEDEDTITKKNGNGAILRYHKKHASTPEHVGYTVTCKDEWEELAKPLLKFETRRINFEAYREAKKKGTDQNKFFMWEGVYPFEMLHPLCGHENMLVGMALEPEWVADMSETYTDLTIAMLEELFSKEGKPDGFFCYEDMGFKERPFMSPAMYRELIMPSHKKLNDFAHSLNLPVMMHSCGFIEPLLPHMVESGIDGLQAMEIKAGMDLIRVYKNFGDKIALMGGLDIRVLETNDFTRVDKLLEEHIPIVKEGGAYFLHTDHSVPNTVNFDTYKHFVEKGLELGKY